MESLDKQIENLSIEGTYRTFKSWMIHYLNITMLIKTVFMIAMNLDDQVVVGQTFIPLFMNTAIILVILHFEKHISKQSVLTLFTEIINIVMYVTGLVYMPDHKEIFIITSSVNTLCLGINQLQIRYAILQMSKLIIVWYAGPIMLGMKSLPYLPSPYFVTIYSLTVLTLVLIEKRKLLEKHVTTSIEIDKMRNNLNNIIQAIPESVAILSTDNNITLYNAAFQDIFLDSASREIHDIVENFVYLENEKVYVSPSYYLYNDIIHYLHSPVQYPVTFGTTLYNERTLEWRGSKIDWQGSIAVILTIRDVSSIIECARAKSEAQRKTTLLRTVSHEIRTPTNAIISLSEELLHKQEMLPSEMISNIRIINISSKLLHNLLNDLLDFSRMVADCFSIDKIEFEIRPFLDETFDLFALQCGIKKLDYKLNIDPNIPQTIKTDPNRLRQIIINLISNSLKFTLKGRIELSAYYKRSNRLLIKVIDTGLGIPPEKLQSIFTAFNKTHDLMLNPQGCGLGLYISNMFAKALGGSSIHVESKFNKGSIFSFEIDTSDQLSTQTFNSSEDLSDFTILTERDNIQVPKALSANSSFRYVNSKVLVVDDDYFNRLVLKSLLKDSYVLIEEAQSGYEALDMIKAADHSAVKIKLVILDFNMPGLSGPETYIEMKKLHQEYSISILPRVVIYSGDNSEECIDYCRRLGIDDFLVKPASRASILNLIQRYL